MQGGGGLRRVPHLEMVACVYTISEILQFYVPKYGRLQLSNFLPLGLIEDTGWGFNKWKLVLQNIHYQIQHMGTSSTWK